MGFTQTHRKVPRSASVTSWLALKACPEMKTAQRISAHLDTTGLEEQQHTGAGQVGREVVCPAKLVSKMHGCVHAKPDYRNARPLGIKLLVLIHSKRQSRQICRGRSQRIVPMPWRWCSISTSKPSRRAWCVPRGTALLPWEIAGVEQSRSKTADLAWQPAC